MVSVTETVPGGNADDDDDDYDTNDADDDAEYGARSLQRR